MTTQLLPGDESLTELSPSEYLLRLGLAKGERHDLATAALMLAALDRPEKKLAPFRAHLSELAQAVRAEADFARDAEGAAEALASVIAGHYGYEGERSDYDDPRNADLMSVIERRRGLPVALGILYIHAARACRMDACGLFAPGHFLLRIGARGSEAVIDPFNNGAVVDRERMNMPRFGARLHLAESGSTDRTDAFTPVGDGEVLLRLQNNIKNRALKTRDTPRAIEILRRMTLISPRRSVLWLELGRLQESTGALSAARNAYESCLRLLPSGDEISNEAAFALNALKRRLN